MRCDSGEDVHLWIREASRKASEGIPSRRPDYSRKIDSYTKNMTAALGMTRIKCALKPP